MKCTKGFKKKFLGPQLAPVLEPLSPQRDFGGGKRKRFRSTIRAAATIGPFLPHPSPVILILILQSSLAQSEFSVDAAAGEDFRPDRLIRFEKFGSGTNVPKGQQLQVRLFNPINSLAIKPVVPWELQLQLGLSYLINPPVLSIYQSSRLGRDSRYCGGHCIVNTAVKRKVLLRDCAAGIGVPLLLWGCMPMRSSCNNYSVRTSTSLVLTTAGKTSAIDIKILYP